MCMGDNVHEYVCVCRMYIKCVHEYILIMYMSIYVYVQCT